MSKLYGIFYALTNNILRYIIVNNNHKIHLMEIQAGKGRCTMLEITFENQLKIYPNGVRVVTSLNIRGR